MLCAPLYEELVFLEDQDYFLVCLKIFYVNLEEKTSQVKSCLCFRALWESRGQGGRKNQRKFQRWNVFTGLDTIQKVLPAEHEWTNEKLPDDDDIHAGDVNGETPPVHIATNIEAAEKYTPAKSKCNFCLKVFIKFWCFKLLVLWHWGMVLI